MELRQLEYFVAVAEEANFTRAAERVHISQSGVSAQIRRLEQQLGAPLFDRSGRVATLTPAGAAALEHARAASPRPRRAAGRRRRERPGPRPAGGRDGDRLQGDAAVRRAGRVPRGPPGRRAHADRGQLRPAGRRVRGGAADLALIGPPRAARGPGRFPVISEGLVAVVPAGHPLARRARDPGRPRLHPVVCLPEGTGIRTVFDRGCAARGIGRTSRCRRARRTPSPTSRRAGSASRS